MALQAQISSCEDVNKIFKVRIPGTDFIDYQDKWLAQFNAESHSNLEVLARRFEFDSVSEAGQLVPQRIFYWAPVIDIEKYKTVFDHVAGCYVVTNWEK